MNEFIHTSDDFWLILLSNLMGPGGKAPQFKITSAHPKKPTFAESHKVENPYFLVL